MKFLKKLQFKDQEILQSLSLIGHLGLNVVVSLLIFFLFFLWLDRKLQTGNVLLIFGILIGIFAGFYLNYRFLKRFYDQKK